MNQWIARLAVVIAFASGLAPAQREPGETGLTGPLSEEQFAKMHELTGAEAPPARGTMIDVGDQRAYLSLPKGAEPPIAAIVVIHEWWGLNGHVKHWADRLAHDGYAAIAVDLYGGEVAKTRADAMKLYKGVFASAKSEAKALERLLAAYRFAASDPRILATRRAVVGWCFGGAWSLRLALAAPDLDAAIIYYGRLVTDPQRLAKIGDRTHLLGIFGNRDRGIPPRVVDAFEAGLKQAKRHATILRYDANHAFANPSSGRYDAKAAKAAWQRVRGFLATRLKKSVQKKAD